MILVSALAALALAAAPEAAVSAEKAAPATAAAPALDSKAAVKTKKVCTETPAISGSRMPKRKCKTVEVKDTAAPAAAGVKADAQHQH
ncbi:hypothetical protein [Phenylobacterium sp. J367]|uniref:hypothetical protein n=1 Tax=Phenylobacterium sp. J367 TaxID=2898435 RepID=UPI002151EC4E|nr:hypothetical protein [Phenylobacterium sp. J367]MCR5878961.1 hypothetical protein [Phenylobacterium sp. J367]